VVFSPSIGKRVMVRMPDSPATSLVQLSALPAPSEVTTPMPVTTTIGRPNLSRVAVMMSPVAWWSGNAVLFNRFDQGHAFAAVMSSPNHHNLGGRAFHFNLDAGGIACRKQGAAGDRQCGQREAERELRLHGVAETRAAGAHRHVLVLGQEGTFFRRDR